LNGDEMADTESQVEEWLGVVKYQQEFYAVTGITAEFILDYHAYDPTFDESTGAADFRNGLLTVDVNNAQSFINALNGRRLTSADIDNLIQSPTEPDLIFFIDFDAKRYVHSYHDMMLEKSVPRGWKGLFGDPRQELRRQTREGLA
jgi:hypothetical protein